MADQSLALPRAWVSIRTVRRTQKRLLHLRDFRSLALQLRIYLISDSLGHHDSSWGFWDVGRFDRDDAGAVGVVAAGCEASDAAAVHASARGPLGGEFSGGLARRGHWDADALRDIVRDYALETLVDDDAVLVIGETGFLKQGKASCGVARQYTSSAGKIANCQIGVFTCYVAPRGHAFIDRELYLPKSWTDDPARMAKAHVPQEIIDGASGGLATKPALARAMNSSRRVRSKDLAMNDVPQFVQRPLSRLHAYLPLIQDQSYWRRYVAPFRIRARLRAVS